MTLGELLWNKRQELNLTLVRAAILSDIRAVTLHRIELDRVPNPSFRVVQRICAAYGLSFSLLRDIK